MIDPRDSEIVNHLAIDRFVGSIYSDDVVALARAVDRIGEIDRMCCRQRVDAGFSSAALARRLSRCPPRPQWDDEKPRACLRGARVRYSVC